MKPTLAIQCDERQPDPQSSLEIALTEPFDEGRGQGRANHACHARSVTAASAPRQSGQGSPGKVDRNPPMESGHMEKLRGWLLLIAVVVLSASGCASSRDWAYWRDHPTHFASGGHMTFSTTNNDVYYPIVTDSDVKQARDHGWWGDEVPLGPPADLSGRWIGTWRGLGLFDSIRQGDVEITLEQHHHIGIAHLHLDNTIAAGVPWIIRIEGSRGVQLVYRVAGNNALMRNPDRPAEVLAAFTLVNDRLIGTFPNAESPVDITLSRAR